MAASWKILFFPLLVFAHTTKSATDAQDAAVLRSLKYQWGNTPPGWGESDDPCVWEGVTCNNSSVTSLGLSTMGLTGHLSGDIGGLAELISLDLSFNPGLAGPLSSHLGDLHKLTILILAGCSFSSSIPPELGNLAELTFLSLYSNNLTGEIPMSLGSLSKLYWLDLSDNQLTGQLPVSSASGNGLDKLKKAKHFHFNKNQLTGEIPASLFDPGMSLIHLLLDSNKLEGSIPSTIGLVKTLEVLRLDRNYLTGGVPSNLKNLTNIIELNFAHNMLSGAFPNLSGINSLNYVDLSNNSFKKSEAPNWFPTLQSLTTLVVEYGSIEGNFPSELLSLPQLQQVNFRHNSFSGKLEMSDNVSKQLELIDLENNEISSITVGTHYQNTLLLLGNPVCSSSLERTDYCQFQQLQRPYSTSLATCGSLVCNADQKLNPKSCECAYPYEGTLYFRAPFFRDLSNASLFHSLEMSLWMKLGLSPGSVSLEKPFFNADDYLQVHLQLFPSEAKFFNRSEVQNIGFSLSNQTYKPPREFGPYYFIAWPYSFRGTNAMPHISTGWVLGIATGGAILFVVLAGLCVYALHQTLRAMSLTSQDLTTKGVSQTIEWTGTRCFSLSELKKCTKNFSRDNQIGSGGYGKVYKGILPNGQLVAIKRAKKCCNHCVTEFKNEIELLSRVHHKNLVGLVGFCFDQAEQMLIYEHMANGSLRESLSGARRIHLDWKHRIKVALDTARGLAYLHELADPPIIHRDVKSTNILLDHHLTAKVADFGLSKLVSDSLKGHISTQVKGTLGYLDPEYYLTQQLTEKSDVYSFGVVMLELITALQPIQKGKYIVYELRAAMNKDDEKYCGLRDLIDPVIVDSPNLAGFPMFLELAMQCVQESASDRPTMAEVVKSLEILLQSDGLKTCSTSASSSATEFGALKSRSWTPLQ